MEAEVKQFIYEFKGQTYVDSGITALEEKVVDRSINKRLYLKYLQQAADGWITIARLQELLNGKEENVSPWEPFIKTLITSIEVDPSEILVNFRADP